MLRCRRTTQFGKVILDTSILAAAFSLAFLLRFEFAVPDHYAAVLLVYLPAVVAWQLGLLALGGVLRSTWRHTSLCDALRLFNWLAGGTALLFCGRILADAGAPGLAFLSNYPVPFGVLLFNLALSFLGLIGARVAVRLRNERGERRASGVSRPASVRTLLIGAGRAGVLVAREIHARPDTGIEPVGFLDDDPSLSGMRIQGLPVLGTTAQLARIARNSRAEQALITIASVPGTVIRRIARLAEESGLTTKIIPPLHEIVGGQINLSKIRQVAIEDLLRRDPVCLDGAEVSALVRGRTVLVTGAGGSIGSELCRIIAGLGPAALVLVEQAENSLFHAHLRLAHSFPHVPIIPCIADICDEARMDQVFGRFQPALVFHAAAHKHVPMMEWNPGEAVKNNVLGTRTIASLADAWGVERFVMISTDKAVNPTSVMGVSKRVAELFIQSFARRSATRFMTVRFGNVLGSAGSVIPIFQEQIARGGPVTVTHPEMKRYFMTIPEACQLVLQAAAMGAGGEIFILDMGEPVKIVDLARDLIRLSGLSAEHDVEIRFTGIRPGEKLFEELFHGAEGADKTRHPRIFIGRGQPADWTPVNRAVTELGELAGSADPAAIHKKLAEIVPEYQYTGVRDDVVVAAAIQGPHPHRDRAPQAPAVPAAAPGSDGAWRTPRLHPADAPALMGPGR
ncbi:MAG: polysaccharide biosynthesis protein [Gemmataceae bacterium]|nr:polysaccharide biosynthesis protein [Gemmataceae bacterium]